MGVLTAELREVAGSLVRRADAPAQAGIFSGDNPAEYNVNDPIRLWVIQVVIIIGMTQLLSLFLSRIRQPRVIAEVIGGVILGPSIMGRIPNFSNTIFPKDSLPMLNLTSTIGLVLFLFLVGLEIDVRMVKRNAKASMIISAAGLIVPLGLGAALGVPIYNQFISPDVNFGYFVLFTAVAIGITAFPVLCRILTELKLLDTTVGVVVLSAGVGNDVVGWILLALTVALVNAANGLTALWVLLTAVGYVIFLLLPVRWGFHWLARWTGSLENGQPTAMMMTVTLLLVFISAFFTDIIGIHAIFGGFLAGLIIPHENGFAISLYFALSGLRTNLGLLNNGITWGYVVLICVIAFFSKFLGCGITAKLFGFNWRESGAIGALMSCKGLVELIVLNVGLQAGILDTRTFSMFVLHALVLTFMTTPLTLLLYPAKYRVHSGTVHDKPTKHGGVESGNVSPPMSQETFITKVAVVLDKIEQLPTIMTLTQLLQYSATHVPPPKYSIDHSTSEDEKASQVAPSLTYNSDATAQSPVSVDALRLIELTDRTSAVLMSQNADSLIRSDPVLSVIRTFGYLNRMIVTTALSVVGWEEFPSSVTTHVKQSNAQMVIIPWSSGSVFTENTENDNAAEGSNAATPAGTPGNPFEAMFGQKQSGQSSAVVHTQFIRKIFTDTPADVALYVDRGLPQTLEGQGGQHIFLPFFGGPDDRLALQFVVQLCMNPSMSATVVRYTKVESNDLSPMSTIEHAKAQHILNTSILNTTFGDTAYGAGNTQTRLQSDTTDNLLWERYSNNASPEVADALHRVNFEWERSSKPLHAVLDAASQTINHRSRENLRVVVVVGRSCRMALESHTSELRELIIERSISMGSDVAKTLGPLGAAFVATNANTSLLVLQASHH
ncbi:unnamed protein product [Somion occarium]|uniref:Cation/H+ exchanger transmembrane domain-containing protein n=1 Tax=Somion occarium TaxID=3059160 RepID=A0ABP1CZV2_9APHY